MPMTTAIHQPHDKLFKKAMQQIVVAREFFTTHLPKVFLQQADISTLRIEKTSFITEFFEDKEADLLYSVKLLDSRTAYLYLLCENQDRPDKMMAFRLLDYQVQIIKDHIGQHPNDPLPVVFPLVLYTGKQPWTAPMDIYPLFGEQEPLARSFWLKPYTLIDLHRMSDEILKQHNFSGLVEFALKHRKASHFEKFLTETFPWIESLKQQNAPLAIFLGGNVLFYFLGTNKSVSKETFKQLAEQHLSTTTRGEIMTLAEQFRHEGLEQGIQQGIQQGESTILLHLLKLKFRKISDIYLQKITDADADMLLVWSERVLTAKTIEDVFAE